MMHMKKADRVELFRVAMMWAGSAFVLGGLFGFVVGIGVGAADE